MTLLTLTVFQLEGTPPEEALKLIKKGAESYTGVDLQDVTYLSSEARPDELLILSTWGNVEAVSQAAALWEQRMPNLQKLGLKPELQQTTVLKVVREFQRYHLTAQASSISVGRITDPQLNLEQVLGWVKKSTQEFLLSWPELVRHRMAHTFDGSNLILFHNDWVSVEGWQAYKDAFSARYLDATAKSGVVEYLYTASRLLDTFKAKVHVSEPTALKSDSDES